MRRLQKTMLFPFFLVSVTLFLPACSNNNEPEVQQDLIRPAKIFIAHTPDSATKRVYPGTVEAANKSELSFRVGGQLRKLNAKPGMEFKKGEILAQLDDAEYVNILADRQAKYDLAASQYKKIEALFEKKYVSPSEVDQAKAELQASKAALSTAKDNVKYTDLIAPFDGIVATVSAENFQSIQANQPFIQYHNSDTLDIRYSVPESLLGNVKRVEDPSTICAQVRFNAHPQDAYTACFKEFESVPDPLTRSYGVVHSMQQIEDFQVLPGMAVTVELDLTGMLINTGNGSVLIPIEAVSQKGEQTKVWKVQADNTVTQVNVVTGAVQDKFVFIESGIQPGDAIVAAGVSYLREGMKVKAMTKERGL